MRSIERVAEAALEEYAPEVFEGPQPLDVADLVDYVLPTYGIHVVPATSAELDGAEGLTSPEGTKSVDILVSAEQFEALEDRGPRGNRARATVCHELGHAILHVPIIRRRLNSPLAPLLLKRVSPRSVPAYEDAEWQAWAFAGAILMPRRALAQLDSLSPEYVASLFNVSENLAINHLRRLRL